MTTAPTQPVRLSVSLSAHAFTEGDLSSCHHAVSTMMHGLEDDLGIPVGTAVDITLDQHPQLCKTVLGGRELLLSGRRRLLVTAGVLGGEDASMVPEDVDGFLTGCALAASPDQRCRLAAEFVRACLVTNLEALVTAHATSSMNEASQLSDDGRTAWAHSAVELARFGVAPIRVEEVWAALEPSSDESGQPHISSVSAFRFDEFPVIEMNEHTLRWVTQSPGLSRPWSMSPEGPLIGLSTSRGVSAALWTTYGIELSEIRLDVDPNIADDRFRIRFGEVTTSPYLLLPADLVALRGMPEWLDAADVRRWVLDPIGGDWWPTVASDRTWEAMVGSTPYIDSVALMMRTLFAEIQTRLARWPGYDTTSDWADILADPLRSRLLEALPEVVRTLLADGVSVGQPAPVLEGMMRGLVDSDGSPTVLVNATRKVLGAAVIGLVPPEHTVELLYLDSEAAEEAASSGNAVPLLNAHPQLVTTTLTHVVVCDEEHRAMVAELLRPLVDVVRVVTRSEIAEAAINLPAVRTA